MEKRKLGQDYEELIAEARKNPDVAEFLDRLYQSRQIEMLSKDQQKYLDIVKECIINNSEFSETMVNIIMDDSSFKDLLPDNEEFIGHYPPEYWANYILEEYIDTVKNVLKVIRSA